MVRYYNSVYSCGCTYSCDMLRLRFELHFENVCKLCERIDNMHDFINTGLDVQYFNSFRESSYRHLFVMKCSDRFITDDLSYSFVVGLQHNSEPVSMPVHGFIEFNPNKCPLDVIERYMGYICDYAIWIDRRTFFELVRYDLAVDVPCPRESLKIVKSGKRTYSYVQGSSLTEYLGKRNSNGYTKVYDKAYESKLDVPLTRIEITCDSLHKIAYPDIQYIDSQYAIDFDLNDTDYVLLSLIRLQPEESQQYWLNKLGRKKKEKLKQYMYTDANMFKFDTKAVFKITTFIDNIIHMIFE